MKNLVIYQSFKIVPIPYAHLHPREKMGRIIYKVNDRVYPEHMNTFLPRFGMGSFLRDDFCTITVTP